MSEFLDPSEKIQKHGAKLPHWQQSDSMQCVTFRLGDAMPKSKLRTGREQHTVWLHHHPKPWTPALEREHHQRFSQKLEQWLDEGTGCCLFNSPPNREILEAILMRDDSTRADHHAWVIMPNHVHLLFTALLWYS